MHKERKKRKLNITPDLLAVLFIVVLVLIFALYNSTRSDLYGHATVFSCDDIRVKIANLDQVREAIGDFIVLRSSNTVLVQNLRSVLGTILDFRELWVGKLITQNCGVAPPKQCSTSNSCDSRTNEQCTNGVCTVGTIGSCGDGTIDLGEVCDDGNANNGDGCGTVAGTSCAVESGFTCTGTPSVCTQPTTSLCDLNRDGTINDADFDINGDGTFTETDFDALTQAAHDFIASGRTTCTLQVPTARPCDFDRDGTVEDEDFFKAMQCMIDQKGDSGTSTTKAICTVPFPLPTQSLPPEAVCLGALSVTEAFVRGSPSIFGNAQRQPIPNPFRFAPYLTASTTTKDFDGDGTADPALVCKVNCDASNVDLIRSCFNANDFRYSIDADPTCGAITTTPTCGNGVIETGEQCDQGSNNLVNGDGCSATCQVEANWQCTGTPSKCTTKLSLTRLQTIKKSIILHTNKWLVFKSDVSQNPQTDDIIGNLMIADDRINLFETPTPHQYEYWVTWVYQNALLQTYALQIITDKTNLDNNLVQVYLDDALVDPYKAFNLHQHWNSIVIKMKTGAMMTGTTLAIGSIKLPSFGGGTPTATKLGDRVLIMTHYNFDYNNDGKLSSTDDPNALGAPATDTCEGRVLMCILDTDLLTPYPQDFPKIATDPASSCPAKTRLGFPCLT